MPNTTIIEFNGTSAQAVGAMTYYDLTFTNSGAKSIIGSATVNHDMLVNLGAPVTITNTGTLLIKGDLDNSGVLTIDGTMDVTP